MIQTAKLRITFVMCLLMIAIGCNFIAMRAFADVELGAAFVVLGVVSLGLFVSTAIGLIGREVPLQSGARFRRAQGEYAKEDSAGRAPFGVRAESLSRRRHLPVSADVSPSGEW